jgi:hypothetical protein
MATTFMNLSLPTPTVTLGPAWATQLNLALEAVDAHDHSDGKGTRVKTAGLNINADLTFNTYKAFGLMSTQFVDQTAAPLSGSTNALSLHSHSGNLYWVNGSGVAVPITSGAAVVSTPGTTKVLQYNEITATPAIDPITLLPIPFVDADNDVVQAIIASSGSIQVTLPLANSVAAGRLYIIKDASGTSETWPLTVYASGSDAIDGASSLDISSNYEAVFLVSDGNSKWFAV